MVTQITDHSTFCWKGHQQRNHQSSGISGPLCWDSIGQILNPSTKGQWCRRCVHISWRHHGSLQWCHNERDGATDHQRFHWLLNRLPRRTPKKNIKAPRHWPLWGESTGDRWIPHTEGQWCGKCFHLMTSSCKTVFQVLSNQIGVTNFVQSTHQVQLRTQRTPPRRGIRSLQEPKHIIYRFSYISPNHHPRHPMRHSTK